MPSFDLIFAAIVLLILGRPVMRWATNRNTSRKWNPDRPTKRGGDASGGWSGGDSGGSSCGGGGCGGG